MRNATADERGTCTVEYVVVVATLAAWTLVVTSVAALIVGGTAAAKEVERWCLLSMALTSIGGPILFVCGVSLRDWWVARLNHPAAPTHARSDALQL